MEQKNLVLILSSPSGAGKTSLAKAIIEQDKKFVSSVSMTTRPKRSTEIENQDYYFVSKEEFIQMRKQDKFLEDAEVFGNYYGTPQDYVMEKLANSHDVLFDIDWQGAESIKEKLGKLAISIFILPPSMIELENRLNSRGQNSIEEISQRLEMAKFEISKHHLYDYVLINRDFNETLNNILNIISVERLKHSNYQNFIEKLLK